jgi:uncharacterized protein with PIN domain/sulfur carrier protein ThiS
MTRVGVRMYGPLNDLVPPHRRQVTWSHLIAGDPTVKDLVESLGVPHPEVDLILANGTSVPFDYAVQDGDRIAVFPRFMTFDIGTLTCVRPPALDPIRFVADVHLGTLARRLRLIGVDTTYRVDAHDAELADVASCEGRILLTRDAGLLKRRIVTHGYFVRETHPHCQLVEVLRRFGPIQLEPFSRCLRCNTELRGVSKTEVDSALQPKTRLYYDRFRKCGGCGRIYWKGSHWRRLKTAINAALQEANRVD